MSGVKSIRHNRNIELVTAHSVASNSLDHTNPLGTINEKNRNFRFYNKCESLLDDLSFLDLRCSDGSLVYEFMLNGRVAIGLDGRDSSKAQGRAWRTISGNLFHCDITEKFELLDCTKKEISRFNIISCWEVLEHIPEEGLETFFLNVERHIEDIGIFVGSIPTATNDIHNVTTHNKDWWRNMFLEHGFRIFPEDEVNFEFSEFCLPFVEEAEHHKRLETWFHFVAMKINK